MYVIATVICPNFHFSVSPHVPFLNLLFEQIANSNEYLLAKIGVDTAENEPLKVWRKIQFIIHSSPYMELAPSSMRSSNWVLQLGDPDSRHSRWAVARSPQGMKRP